LFLSLLSAFRSKKKSAAFGSKKKKVALNAEGLETSFAGDFH